jgi:hypothetical protein
VIVMTKSERSKIWCAELEAGASVLGVVPCAMSAVVTESHAAALLKRIRRPSRFVCIFCSPSLTAQVLAFIDLMCQKSSPSDVRQRDSSNAEKGPKLHVSGIKEVHLTLSRG